ncbi:hypothetical protein HPB50_010401 [Hyalomma asiaticum]|uniref:Uncharacterized protein n=1 Tax=Hyalomma asiaticum TaxID=266040 RepID=A0ACB7RVG4_HYAAI|nr:hypothetical protein HPB50_010401 [Hyalomma asiaticum]
MVPALVTILKSSALLVLVLAEQRAASVNGDADCKPTCKVPEGPLFDKAGDPGNDIRYIYNGTNCTDVLVKPDRFNDTFPDRISCIGECNPGTY